ncbi:MAG: serine/threonine protein kinase [Gemmataceae bacterium]|nr:serine/threonine protein kinase [Gemmataceae bacterium]MCI0738515.1 serine/threonine protein kinase [Gemmataceae bacterium]
MAMPSARRDKHNLMRPVSGAEATAAEGFLQLLLQNQVIAQQDWDNLESQSRTELKHHSNMDRFLLRLVDYELLTQYQATRLQNRQVSGLILGPYRLRDRLGGGNSGVIFKAEHLETRQIVALKVLIPGRPDDPAPLMRFDAERKTIAELQHPHIVQLLDAGQADSEDPDSPVLHFYAMEFVNAPDLEAYVHRQGPLKIHAACLVGCQIADALAFAHDHRMVHRDVNPTNILWAKDGKAKLLDFGLVKQYQNRFTKPGSMLGTLEYIAPEQAQDASSVDGRADIYSLGATLFFCLTGQPPFSAGPDFVQAVTQRMTEPPPSIRDLRPEVSTELEAVLTRLMAVQPEARWRHPREVVQALQRFLDPMTTWKPISSNGAPQYVAEVPDDTKVDEQVPTPPPPKKPVKRGWLKRLFGG